MFESLWGDPHYSLSDIGKTFGISVKLVGKWARLFLLPPKKIAEDAFEGPHPGDPTPEQIEELGAYLRAHRIIAQKVEHEKYIPRATYAST
jgi:hypothetical protein